VEAKPAADAKPFRPFRIAADRDRAIFGLKVSKVRDCRSSYPSSSSIHPQALSVAHD
jgi:hypothetical protein